MSINENEARNFMLLYLWMRYLWEMYINIKQYEVCKNVDTVPDKLVDIMQKEEFDKARSKMIDQTSIKFIETTYSLLTATTVITTTLLAIVWSYAIKISPTENEIILSCIWSFLLTGLSLLIDLPSSIYRTFVIQKKYDLTTSSISYFILEELQKFCLSQFFALPVFTIIIWLVKYIQYAGNWFYISVWIIFCLFTLSSLIIYPLYFAPFYNHYQPLPQGELRISIEELAQSVNFPLDEVYLMKEIKQPLYTNAYVYGLYGAKHIVLSETLLGNSETDGCQNDEILALLSHELGHWVYHHSLIHVLLGQIYMIFTLITYKMMLNSQYIYRAVGFAENIQPLLPGLTVTLEYVLEPLNALMTFLYNYSSRCHEFQADAFVKNLRNAVPLQKALLHLNKNYAEFPVYDKSFSVWYYSRPTLLQRLDALETC